MSIFFNTLAFWEIQYGESNMTTAIHKVLIENESSLKWVKVHSIFMNIYMLFNCSPIFKNKESAVKFSKLKMANPIWRKFSKIFWIFMKIGNQGCFGSLILIQIYRIQNGGSYEILLKIDITRVRVLINIKNLIIIY